MAQRVTAIFTNREDAERAADALVSMGADRSAISTVVRHAGDMPGDVTANQVPHHDHAVEPARDVGDAGAALTTSDPGDTAKGAEAGAVLGAIAGIAAGAAMLAVPGFGLILAAGPLSWAIGGAVGATIGGAVAGGVYGHLRDIGIDEIQARAYEQRLRGGDILMTALVPGLMESRVRDVLVEQNAEDVTFVDDPMTARYSPPASRADYVQPAASPTRDAADAYASPAAGRMGGTASPTTLSQTYVEATSVESDNRAAAKAEEAYEEKEEEAIPPRV